MSALCAIQLEFSNGIKSPLYETKESKEKQFELKRAKFDHTQTIREISMKVGQNAYDSFTGFKLNDGYIADVVWSETSENAKWVTQRVPDGNEIIGIQCDLEERTIRRLRFALWNPDSTIISNIRRRGQISDDKAYIDFDVEKSCKTLSRSVLKSDRRLFKSTIISNEGDIEKQMGKSEGCNESCCILF